MDDERRKREMIKRLGRMEEIMSAGDRKRIREVQREKEAAEAAAAAEAAKKVKPVYAVGSTSYEMSKRLTRMEELEAEGKRQQSKQTKKDLWAKLSDQAKKKYS